MVFIVITTATTNSTRNEHWNSTVTSVQQTRRGRNVVGIYSVHQQTYIVCTVKKIIEGKN